jgi:predicted Zn-dependent peptidase
VAYEKHPYRWPTIGMDISHLEKVRLNDVKEFFLSHYSPDNAILAVAGNISTGKTLELVKRWFSDAEKRIPGSRVIPVEPMQLTARHITVERSVPSDHLYKAWHVGTRSDNDFRVLDLLTDILSGGESGRLYEALVREKRLFSEINAYLTGDMDPGLLLFAGKLMEGTDIRKAEEEVNLVLGRLKSEIPDEWEIEKVKNRFESTTRMSNLNVLNKAVNLCLYESLGDAEMINAEVKNYRLIQPVTVTEVANKYLTEENCTTLYYKSMK